MPDSSTLDFDIFAKNSEELRIFPKKIIWLSGAPGAGKGTHEETIIRHFKLYREALVASFLLNTPEMLEKINRGLLLDDRTVVSAVLTELKDPSYADGVLVDGFPRTPKQAESVSWLYRQMTFHGHHPLFVILVLMIDENESLRRQQSRAQLALRHNENVRRAGIGELEDVRPTDLDPHLARQRYRQFMDITYAGLESLKGQIPFYRIDAHGSIDDVRGRLQNVLVQFH
jgi:adenylate kinase